MKLEDVKPSQALDAIVVGAGFAGLYMLIKLRQLGMRARVIEAGDGVGGTWYWNRYPGARCDSEAEIYQYWFSKDMYAQWKPTERFPAQPETERWLNFVADRLDLKKDIAFNTRIVSAHFNEETGRWLVKTDQGDITCEHVVSATGNFARKTGAMVGLDIPVIPVEHQYIVTEPHPLIKERQAKGLPESAGAFRRLKAQGFSDRRLAKLTGLARRLVV